VITGFNTDIEHDGVVYHVQTEDKGLASPLILSLVYSGGAILASKRTRYEDLIAAGFDEEVLSERLKRQHRLICAAINAGRLEDLKRMGARVEGQATEGDATDAASPVTEPVNVVPPVLTSEAVDAATDAEAIVETSAVDDAPPVAVGKGDAVAEEDEGPRSRERAPGEESAYTVYDPRRQSPFAEDFVAETGATLTMLDEHEFRARESFTIRVLLEDRSGKKEKPLAGVAVSVKILGTSFRPQIYSVKTARDGVAVVSTDMPSFTSGRAAIVIRAVVKGQTVEVRRVIHAAERPGQ